MANTATITEVPVISEGSSLKDRISRVPQFSLYLNCLENFPFDERRFSEEAHSFLQTIQNQPEEAEFIGGLDPDREVRAATVEVIKIIFKLGLVDREALVAMGKIAGPGNVKVIAGAECGFIDIDPYLSFAGYPLDTAFPVAKLPLPPSKGIRNEHIKLGIGVSMLENLAEEFIAFAKEKNLPLSAHKAWRLAVRSVVAHELGHALDQALLSQGTSTAAGAATFLQQKYSNLPRDFKDKIHIEHFATGIENLLIKELMVSLSGCNENEAEKFLEGRYERMRPRVEAVFALLQWVKENGFSIEDITRLESKLHEIHNRNYQGVDIALIPYIPDALSVLQYSDRPYSEDEIRCILGKEEPLRRAA